LLTLIRAAKLAGHVAEEALAALSKNARVALPPMKVSGCPAVRMPNDGDVKTPEGATFETLWTALSVVS